MIYKINVSDNYDKGENYKLGNKNVNHSIKTTSLLTALDLERQLAEEPGAKGPVRNTVT